MQRNDASIHFSAPDSAPVVLVIIDMFSDFESERTAPFFKQALAASARIAKLRQRAVRSGIPTIFANDNYGRWKSEGRQIVQMAKQSERGRKIVELLQPAEDDYIVLKPKHSIFFATPVEVLLHYLGTHTLILTGMTSTRCVLFSAIEAYLRDLKIIAPLDCLVSENKQEHRMAKFLLETRVNADTRQSRRLRLTRLQRSSGAEE